MSFVLRPLSFVKNTNMLKFQQTISKYLTPVRLGILDQMVVSGGNFTIGLLLARWLGLDDFGAFTLLWMVVLFALSLNMALITKPLLTLVPKKKNQEGYLGSVHSLQIILAVWGSLITLGGLYLATHFEVVVASLTMISSLATLVGTQLIYDFYRK